MTLEERFAAFVDVNGPVMRIPLSPCHVWTGALDDNGYGRFSVGGKNNHAHRVALSLLLGRPLERGECALHHCDNPPCVLHLYAGSKKQNAADAWERGQIDRFGGPRRRGEQNGNAKASEEIARQVRALYATGAYTQEILGNKFRLSETTIRAIVIGARWAS